MKVGDLVVWNQGYCQTPGLVLETKPSKAASSKDATLSATGIAALAVLPDLGNDPEWFHECELEIVNESR